MIVMIKITKDVLRHVLAEAELETETTIGV